MKPTTAQTKAGNYAKKHLWVQGLAISIETPKGHERSGIGSDGKPWSVRMPVDYGYFKRTRGRDGDHVDVFLGPNRASEFVVIVNQFDRITHVFDEHKVMLGFNSLAEAKAAYRSSFTPGFVPQAEFVPAPVQRLKEWLRLNVTHDKFELRARTPRLTELSSSMKRSTKDPEKPSLLRRIVAIGAPVAGVAGMLAYAHLAKRPRNPTYPISPSDPKAMGKRGLTPHYPVSSKPKGPESWKPMTPTPDGVWTTPGARKVSTAPKEPKSVKPAFGESSRKLTPAIEAPSAPAAPAAAAPSASTHIHAPAAPSVAPAVKPKIKAPVERPKIQAPGGAPKHVDVTKPSVKSALEKLRSGVPESVKKKITEAAAKVFQVVQFNERDSITGMYGAADGAMTAYRKGRRMIPWIRRGNDVVQDSTDIASGKHVSQPFYKKQWFKSAAAGAAIGGTILAARKVNKWHHQDTAHPGSLDTVSKDYPVVGKMPGVRDAILSKARSMDDKLQKRGHGRILTGDTPFFSARPKIRTLDFETVDPLDKGWDLRDARGKSARVYAPGSRTRDRREKTWGEKTDNIRATRNVAILAAGAGLLGTMHYRSKVKALTPSKPSAATNVIKADFKKTS